MQRSGCSTIGHGITIRYGRMDREDPIGFKAGDADLYRYVGDAPTGGTDPSGDDVFVPRDDNTVKFVTDNLSQMGVHYDSRDAAGGYIQVGPLDE